MNRYSQRREYEVYQPMSVEELAAPGIMEAQAEVAQMKVATAMDTNYTGFDFDKDRLSGEITSIENNKASLVQRIANGENVDPSEMMALAQQYGNTFGASGSATQAEAEYNKYAAAKGMYAKNAKDYDANAITFYTDEALQRYADDPTAGFEMSTIARKTDVQKQVNELTKTIAKNNTISTEDYAAAGIKQILDESTGEMRYEEIGTKRKFTNLQARDQVLIDATRSSIMSNASNSAYLSQYSEVNGVDADKYLNSMIVNGLQINSVNNTEQTSNRFNVKPDKATRGNQGGYNSGVNGIMTLAGEQLDSTVGNRELEFTQIKNSFKDTSRHGVDGGSKHDILYDRNTALSAIRDGDPKKAAKALEDYGIKVTPAILADPVKLQALRDEINKTLTDKADRASTLNNEQRAVVKKMEKEFYAKEENKDSKAKRDAYNEAITGLDQKVVDWMEEQDVGSFIWNNQFQQDLMYENAKREGFKGTAKEFEDKYKTIKSYQATDDEANLQSYYEENIDRFHKDYKGTESAVYDIEQGLVGKEKNHVEGVLSNAGRRILKNPDTLSTNDPANGESWFGMWGGDAIPWNEIDFHSISAPNSGNQISINMSYAPGAGKPAAYETLSFDLRSKEGRDAAAAVVELMPDGDRKEMLALKITSQGMAGDNPTIIPQKSGFHEDITYQKNDNGSIELIYTDPRDTSRKVDLTDAYNVSTYARELKNPYVQQTIDLIQQNSMQIADETARNEYLEVTLKDELSKIMSVQDASIVILSLEAGGPDLKAEILDKHPAMKTYLDKKVKEKQGAKQMQTNYVDIMKFLQSNEKYGIKS